jgi:hypothetical protein
MAKIIKVFSLDYDKHVSAEAIDKDALSIYLALKALNQHDALITSFLTGPKGHRSLAITNIKIKFAEALKIAKDSNCSRTFVAVVMLRSAFFARESERIIFYGEGAPQVTPAPIVEAEYKYGRRTRVITARN